MHRIRLVALGVLMAADVAGAQPWNADSILVSRENGTLGEYTRAGGLVRMVNIPNQPAGDDVPFAPNNRDVTVGPDGRAFVFNGTFDPYLATFNPVTGGWRQDTFTGWSTVNNGSYGGVAAWEDGGVFVTDMVTFGPGDMPSGIVRFDSTSFTAERFAANKEFIDLTMGLDGLLYGLDANNGVSVYDPGTLAFVRSFSLAGAADTRGIAVGSDGAVYAVQWDGLLRRYSGTGAFSASRATGLNNLYDVDVAQDGAVIASDRDGDVLVTSTDLSGTLVFDASPGSFDGASVSFASYQVASCPADYNGDGFVDGIDYDLFNNDFEAGNQSADINHDGFVDGIDYDTFNNAFEAGC